MLHICKINCTSWVYHSIAAHSEHCWKTTMAWQMVVGIFSLKFFSWFIFPTEILWKKRAYRCIRVSERRPCDTVMHRVSQNICNACQKVVQPVDFHLKESLLSQPPHSSILGIEVPVIRIPESLHELLRIVCPDTNVHMIGHEGVG